MLTKPTPEGCIEALSHDEHADPHLDRKRWGTLVTKDIDGSYAVSPSIPVLLAVSIAHHRQKAEQAGNNLEAY